MAEKMDINAATAAEQAMREQQMQSAEPGLFDEDEIERRIADREGICRRKTATAELPALVAAAQAAGWSGTSMVNVHYGVWYSVAVTDPSEDGGWSPSGLCYYACCARVAAALGVPRTAWDDCWLRCGCEASDAPLPELTVHHAVMRGACDTCKTLGCICQHPPYYHDDLNSDAAQAQMEQSAEDAAAEEQWYEEPDPEPWERFRRLRRGVSDEAFAAADAAGEDVDAWLQADPERLAQSGRDSRREWTELTGLPCD